MRRSAPPARMLVMIAILVLFAGVGCKYRVASTAGISTSAGFSQGSAADQELELGRLAQTGAHWVRLDLDWDGVQAGGPDSWDWTNFDAQARIAEGRGLEVLAVVSFSPGWANGGRGPTTPPTDPATYGRFMAAAVARYHAGGAAGTHVRAWEIWNEPNHPPFWAGAPDARGYVDLLRHAYYAVKSVDGDSIVVSGGMAPFGDLGTPGNYEHPVNFLNAMYFAGAAGLFDALGDHPYAPVPYSPLTDSPGAMKWNSFLYTQTLYEIMVAHGDGAKQIWGTETGPATGSCSNCVSESTQKDWLAQEYVKWRSWTFAGPLFWHAGRDEATGSTQSDDNFGLLHSDFSPKPAFEVAAGLW